MLGIARILLLVLIAGSAACSAVNFRVPVTRPAEINMAPYRQVAIERFNGISGMEVANLLQQEMVKSKRFQVVNRQSMDRILRELQLSASDLSDPKNTVKLGKQLPASALIFGHVEESNYYEQPVTWQDFQRTDNKGRVTYHRRFYRNGNARVRVTFHIDDVETGQVVTSRTFEYQEAASRTAVDQVPSFIDGNAMLVRGWKDVVQKFMKSIVPWIEYEDATLYKDGKLPLLEATISYFRAGDRVRALDAAGKAIEEGERRGLPNAVLGKAYWNHGVIQKYSGNFSAARDNIARAFEYTNDQKILDELHRIDRAEANARQLAEQESAGAGSGF